MSELDYETEFKLSFYEEISTLGYSSKGAKIKLVKHKQSGEIYVIKELSQDAFPFFRMRASNSFFGVPKIEEIIEAPASIFVVEEYINGINLEKKIHEGLFSEKDAVHIICQLCDILSQFHNRPVPVINRDIKPSNIILDSRMQVCLVDFDTSKFHTPDATKDTVLMGTPGYAAPEQYGFLQSDVTTDIYALGVLLNKMLTGEFPTESLYQGKLSKVIKKCISLNPKDRYSSVEVLKMHLNGSARKKHNKTLPGFRSGILWKKAIAFLGYAFLLTVTIYGIYDGFKSGDPKNLHTDLTLILLINLEFLGNLFYLSDYLGIRDRFPVHKSDNALLEFLRISATVILYSFIVFIICALL